MVGVLLLVMTGRFISLTAVSVVVLLFYDGD